jgi:hypothetical protein
MKNRKASTGNLSALAEGDRGLQVSPLPGKLGQLFENGWSSEPPLPLRGPAAVVRGRRGSGPGWEWLARWVIRGAG